MTKHGSNTEATEGVESNGSRLLAPQLTFPIIACAIEVHRNFGPGLLESAYSDAFAYEMTLSGISYEREKAYRAVYKGKRLRTAFRADFLVEGSIIVELKAVTELADIFVAQVITYLKISGCSIGLLINFNVKTLTRGVRRIYKPRNSPLPAAPSVASCEHRR